MVRFDAWWLPDGETHLPSIMTRVSRRVKGRLTYQYHKYEGALPWCRQRRTAIDIGAHVGLWSWWMGHDFDRLVAFEPNAVSRECWQANFVRGDLKSCALGACAQRVGLTTHEGSSGNTQIADGTTVEMRTLDSYGLTEVDLIKIDCDGYESFVLEGARDTITTWRPVVIVEQKPGCGQQYGREDDAAVAMLVHEMGARVRWYRGGDYCCSFPEAA